MERHHTHALSYTSSEEHSYQLDKNISTKNISSENEYYSKEEEKNDWSNIIVNNFKEMKNTMGMQGESFNLNDFSNSQENEEKNKNADKSKNNDKNKNKSRDIKLIKKKEILKNKSKDKKPDKIKEKNISKNKNNSPINKKEITSKKEKLEKNAKIEKKEKKEKKEPKLPKFTVLDNGIVMKRINQQNAPDENNIINERKIKMMKEDIIKDYLSHYNKSEKPPMIINKPKRSFITKKYVYKKKRKDRFKNKNYIKKKTYSNVHTASYGNYNKLTVKSRSTSSSAKPNPKRPIAKSKTILLNRNPNNNIDKLEDKFSSLSTITAKKFSINNNSNLFFNSSNNNKNIIQKRPLSSFNVIRKEIDINLKSSKIDNSFYNKSFNIQKTCQISSITNLNSNIKNNNNININNNRKKIIYENKNFFNELKDLKNAFELSDNNIIINNNTNNINNEINIIDNNTNKFNNEINIIDNNFSERINKKVFLKHNSENNINKDALIIKKRKLNSAKVRGKSYNYFYPKDPSPLFIEFNNKKNINNEVKKENSNVCKKCQFKKHFGCEKNCPICINMKEKNKLKEKKLSNISYYFPFKDKNNTNNSIQNSFRSNNNSINSQKIKQIINHDSFINFINIKMENLIPMDYYNPFYLNSIHTTLNKKKKNKFINTKQIKNDKNKKISNKYNALQNYFE